MVRNHQKMSADLEEMNHPQKRIRPSDEQDHSSPPNDCVFQGLAGCFGEKAAKEYFKDSKTTMRGVPTISAVFNEVAEGKAAFGIVPIENSYSGSLHQVFTG